MDKMNDSISEQRTMRIIRLYGLKSMRKRDRIYYSEDEYEDYRRTGMQILLLPDKKMIRATSNFHRDTGNSQV